MRLVTDDGTCWVTPALPGTFEEVELAVGAVSETGEQSWGWLYFPGGRTAHTVQESVDTEAEAFRTLHVYLLMNEPTYDGCIERERPELFK